jgi:hypothetical protein
MLKPIRDREKTQTAEEAENIRIAHQSLYDSVGREQAVFNQLQSEKPELFTDIPIDPTILEMEEAFRIKQNPLLCIRVRSESEEADYQEERMGYKGEDMMELDVSPPRSVASIDSIARNANFISF